MNIQKTTNIIVGIITVSVVSFSLYLLGSAKNNSTENNLATNNLIPQSVEADSVLSDMNSGVEVSAKISETKKLTGSKVELKIDVALKNTTEVTIQSSPPIDMIILNTSTNKTYKLEASDKTTYFGGPIESKSTDGGAIYVSVEKPNSISDLKLIYQPNNSNISQTIQL